MPGTHVGVRFEWPEELVVFHVEYYEPRRGSGGVFKKVVVPCADEHLAHKLARIFHEDGWRSVVVRPVSREDHERWLDDVFGCETEDGA